MKHTDFVVVTGGEGNLASHLIHQLLQRGYAVRATVLKEDKDSLQHLILLAQALPGDLEFFQADSLIEGSFDEAVNGAKYVFHLASPIIFGTGSAEENQKQVVDVAVAGAKNIMHAAAKSSSSVKRVVMTSSLAAMHNSKHNAPPEAISPPVNGSLYTTEDWNTNINVKDSPYPTSKVQAERTAWKLSEELGIDLVTILPSSICGPPIRNAPGYSMNALKIHLEGASWDEMKVEANIDVRDCALAHIKAAETPQAKGRYLISFETTTVKKPIADALRQNFPFLPIAEASQFRAYRKYDNSRVEEDLGLSDKTYIPIAQSFVDQARAMLSLQMVELQS